MDSTELKILYRLQKSRQQLDDFSLNASKYTLDKDWEIRRIAIDLDKIINRLNKIYNSKHEN